MLSQNNIPDAVTIKRDLSALIYQLLHPLGNQHPKRPSHMWKARIDDGDKGGFREYVIKPPSPLDTPPGYPDFRHEVAIQTLFHASPMIRKMVDFIPPATSAVDGSESKPAMVLQAFEFTLWDARWTRVLSLPEVKWIMKAVILGVWTIQEQDLGNTGNYPSVWFE